MSRALLIATLALGFVAPAYAQHPDHGPPTPQQPAAQPRQTPATPPQAAPPADEHDHSEARQPPTDHAAHAGGEAVPPPEAGNDIPPDAPTDHAADAFFPQADMDRARGILDDEHGGTLISKVMANELEYTSGDGEDGYRWDVEAWYGGDINRFVFKSEGEGVEDLEAAEVQGLYSRAIGPYTDLQIGLRHDIEPQPNRTYLALGAEALLPYWFDAEGALFVGERGQVLGRLEGSYDLMLTQRFVLQPNAELNLALKDDPAIGIGSGLASAEIGLRLRYEFSREFAPYVGVLWERKFGETGDFARADGDDPEETRFVAGLRAWF
jgi:copper resistance protein B